MVVDRSMSPGGRNPLSRSSSDSYPMVCGARVDAIPRFAFVATEVESTPLRERISAGVYQRIKQGAREVLAPFTAADGTLAAPFQVHVVRARPGLRTR